MKSFRAGMTLGLQYLLQFPGTLCLFSCLQLFLKKKDHFLSDVIPHFSELVHNLLFRAGGPGRIGKTHMYEAVGVEEHGTFPLGLIAEGDGQIKMVIDKFIHGFRALPTNIDVNFRHDLNGAGVDLGGPHPGGEGLDLSPQVVVDQAFRHLRAAGIFRAKEENFHEIPFCPEAAGALMIKG
jgi:hypothetical protein